MSKKFRIEFTLKWNDINIWEQWKWYKYMRKMEMI